jgi:hypothetical protein
VRAAGFTLLTLSLVAGTVGAGAPAAVRAGAPQQQTSRPPADPVRMLVSRLDLERFKATIKGLTQFGDRRHGTERNRRAVDWIEARLRADGCVPERMRFGYRPAPPAARVPARAADEPPASVGGGRPRGVQRDTAPNNELTRQPDARLRAINSGPVDERPRDQVFCTKVGASRPGEMYIVGAHMDGRGFGEAANDDASGTALVMELARLFSARDVTTDRSIRFVLWNNEEGGSIGALAYVEQRRLLQGKENPPGSGRFPEPKWLGMIQHDMMLFDHGMPSPDGTVSREQRAEADVNIEFQAVSKMSAASQSLAWELLAANERYATDYPAVVAPHMTNTDSRAFQDHVASVSLRELDRGAQIGSGWDPHWHQATDLYATFSDKDFRLGLNAAQTTLAAVARLAGARIR